ncbi:hypothetical protein GGH94_000600 [Coemansia aciculifera]|uniref:DIS3-like exonuclease 1 n=1 Tax=Coemansia aciculifera TaxID=417176 RepID=A0A9W8IU39_9FUNG|nr:hypothetical protein GGH94_000600 [Coemansia aciculifera]
MLGTRTENVAFRRGKRQGLMMSVTERYLRQDIPCAHKSCQLCPQNADLARRGLPQLSDSGMTLIPDASVVSRYIELLEHSHALTNLVFCQSVVDALDRRNRTRTIRNVRGIAADPRRTSVVFANEVFAQTHVDAILPARDSRAVMRVAAWYKAHLDGVGGQKVVLLTLKASKSTGQYADNQQPGVEVWQFAEFLAEFHPTLVEHFASITESTKDGDMDITEMTPAEYAQARLLAKAQSGYPSHLSPSEIEDGLRSGALVRGKIRILQSGGAMRAESQGIVDRGGAADTPDILIVGRAALNRACTGDTVVVRLLTRAEENAESKDSGIEQSTEETDGEDDNEALAVEQIEAGEETSLDDVRKQVRGVVVGVSERKWRPFVATLQLDEAGGSRHLAVPVDSSVPKIRIHYMDTAVIADKYFVVAIDEWPADSQYPQGHFVRVLGPVGNLDTEVDVILVERQIAVSQSALKFSLASMREMPISTAQCPWSPSTEEVASRRDLRDSLIFSIDPKGSQDIDDAVSMRKTANGGYELGVHIADVSQFVLPGSATDTEAMARGTTVYLADRRFNMIPEILSEQICSLRGLKDRYAVSVIWDLDSEYHATNVWFGRTLIRSACEMYYEQAQALLDGATNVDGLDPKMEASLSESVVGLARAMRVLRQRRYEAGALELASTEVKFTFDKDSGAISELLPKSSLEIHRVIEEAMVFANAAVARRIYEQFPGAALLRRHRSPGSERFARLVDAARTKGFEIDCSSNAALADSLRRITEASKSDPDIVFLAKSMATLAMQEAEYFATGDCGSDSYLHYGLALGFYTHFTSPIRRYADIIVHRQLLEAVAASGAELKEVAVVGSQKWVSDTTGKLNERNRQSKRAQRESTELFQSRYVMQRTVGSGQKHLIADGVVAEIRTNGLIVYVPKFGLRGPVHLRDSSGQIKLAFSVLSGNASDSDSFIEGCSEFAADTKQLSIRLPINVPVFQLGSQVLRFSVFDHVRVSLRVLETRRRRPPVYLTLVSRASSSASAMRAYKSTLLDKALRVSAASSSAAASSAASKKASDSENILSTGEKSTTGKSSDYYSVLERFGEMSLFETHCDVQTL